MRTSIKEWGTALILTVTFGLSGCGGSDTQNTLEDMTWELTAYGDLGSPQAALPAAMVTARFDADSGMVGGSGGCNSYGGDYSVLDGSMAVSNLASTDLHCETPEGVMAQETQYLNLLADAQSYFFQNGALQITCADKKLLIFHRQVELTLTGDDNGSSITLETGQYLLLSLNANPSTGFGWELNASVEPVLWQIGDSTYTADNPGSVGGGGTETFRFKAVEPGETVLSLIYRQPWTTVYAYRFDVNVTVH